MTRKQRKILKRRRRLTRRRFMWGTVAGTMGFCTACAVDAWGIEPEWIEVVEHELPINNLPDAFVGARMVQISDLHCSATVSQEYLRRCIQRVNRLQPDLVVMTGDYITHDERGRYKEVVLSLLSGLQSRLGIYAVFGNHDYGLLTSWHKPRSKSIEQLQYGMSKIGIKVLRNDAEAVVMDGQKIWLAGMGDLWAGDFNPEDTFTQLPCNKGLTIESDNNGVCNAGAHNIVSVPTQDGTSSPVFVLSHNPDTINQLLPYRPDLVMCGHTHGGQVRVPFLGPPILPVKNRQYASGMFKLGNTVLYVNRGLGRLGRIRFNCRPEITVFTLVNKR